MPAETIWAAQLTESSYAKVLEQVDQNMASFLLDMDLDGHVFKRGSLSAVPAAAAAAAATPNHPFATALINGGIASWHTSESFLQKFALVADATREIELCASEQPRRSSFTETFKELGSLSSHSSLNENLNIPSSQRAARTQLISEKIDQYTKSLPIGLHASVHTSTDHKETGSPTIGGDKAKAGHSFWKPATATLFTPTALPYFGPPLFAGGPFLQQQQQQQQQLPQPPGHPLPSHFFDPNMYMLYQHNRQDENETSDDEPVKNQTSQPPLARENKRWIAPMGIMNSSIPPASYMFQHFAPPFPFYPPSMVPPMAPVPAPLHSNNEFKKNEQSPTLGALREKKKSTSPPPSSKSTPSPAPPPAPAPSSTSSPPSRARGRAASAMPKRKGSSRSCGTTPSKPAAPHIHRSPLLEEVRSNSKNKEYTLKDIYGHALEFSKDQHGSRFIQQQLPKASSCEKEVIFNEIRDHSYELMTDVFGNYVIQKYFEHGTATQHQVMLDTMKGHVYHLSMQMYGCRVVQRALEETSTENQLSLVSELQGHVLECAKDQNGNHVVQKLIERIPFERIPFISDALNDHIYHLSTHPYGCRVVQRLLQYLDKTTQGKILAELSRFIFYLVQDQYGNYVMQHILELGEQVDRLCILECVLGQVVTFSKHKYASNVIEKCIKFGSLDAKRKVLAEVMAGNEDMHALQVADDLPLALMMKDQYANYVIQKLVEGFDAKSDEKKLLVTKLRQYLKQLSSKNAFGKHLASVEKMIAVAEAALQEDR